jgi:hypothetical protein
LGVNRHDYLIWGRSLTYAEVRELQNYWEENGDFYDLNDVLFDKSCHPKLQFIIDSMSGKDNYVGLIAQSADDYEGFRSGPVKQFSCSDFDRAEAELSDIFGLSGSLRELQIVTHFS